MPIYCTFQSDCYNTLCCLEFHLFSHLQANLSLLPKGFNGVYLQFPSAVKLTADYSGEYTCTASNTHLGTRQATAIFLVFEPGQ